MTHSVVVIPPVGMAREEIVGNSPNDIKNLMGFLCMCSNIVFCYDISFVVYFDSAQQTYGYNQIASSIAGRNINGNCVIEKVNSDLTKNMLSLYTSANIFSLNSAPTPLRCHT